LVIKYSLGDKLGGGAKILVYLPAQEIIIRPVLLSIYIYTVANKPNIVLLQYISLEELSKLQ